MSYSTSKMVTRWLTACSKFFTRVQLIGVSYMRLDFDGKYTEPSSESSSDSWSEPPLRLKKLFRIDCFISSVVTILLAGVMLSESD